MPTRVLIVDPDTAFAMLLKEGLEADREFRVVDVANGLSALAALQSDPFDLAIVDLGIDDPEPVTLLRAIRDLRPDLPIMVIPLDGDRAPEELAPFDIRGVLTKPFFLPDLPVRVAEALGRPLPAPTPMPSVSPGLSSAPAATAPKFMLPRIALHRDDPRVSEALRALADALSADVALLTAGNALAAHAGRLDRAGAESLAQRILDARAASAQSSRVAAGREQVRFGQSIADSGEHVLYSLAVAESIVLAVAVRPDASLRVVRAQARHTAEALVALGTKNG